MLVILNGAPGAGKTFLLENLYRFQEYKFVPIKKHTTRGPRHFEEGRDAIDLKFNCSQRHIDCLDYNYEYKGEGYGIDKEDFKCAIDSGEIPVIIIRSFEIIERIKADFEDVLVLFIIGASGETLRKQLSLQGRTDSEIKASNEVLRTIIEDYIKNISIIDSCIINCLYDQELYFEQFLSIIKTKHSEKEVANESICQLVSTHES